MGLQPSDLSIVSLRGGLNDTDPPSALADDQCTQADNVEFFASAMGERRMGLTSLDMTGSGLTSTTAIVFLKEWFPSNDPLSPELWAVGFNGAGLVSFARRSGSGIGAPIWTAITPVDAVSASLPGIYRLAAAELNEKLFWAYNTQIQIDRLNVWDGSGLRLTGIGQPDPPTGANEGSGGFGGTRYYRIRHIKKNSAGVILLRSEPSTALTFIPSGSGAGVTLTRLEVRNALNTHANEGQTHWEVEASLDNADFFRIATVPWGTATYNDEISFDTGYSDGTYPLSEAIGAYLTQPAAKFLATDDDRLIWGGHPFDTAQMSMVRWTPVANDPGFGNDERFPIVTTGGDDIVSYRNLDNTKGGPLTGISNAINGTWYAFKWSRIYRATRTGDFSNAYDFKMLTDSRGAIPGTVHNGVDINGAPCVYFLDPELGPSRISSSGIEQIRGIRTTWQRVNVKASNQIACGVFYPYKQQMKWAVAADGSNSPSLGICIQTDQLQPHPEGGMYRGISLFTGKAAQALCYSLYGEWASENGVTRFSHRPFSGHTSPDYIQRTDTSNTDNGTSYTATLVTRPLITAGLLGKWGAMVASLLATALAGSSVFVRLIRNFGVETTGATVVDLSPAGTETQVVRTMDDLRISEANAVQVKISDS